MIEEAPMFPRVRRGWEDLQRVPRRECDSETTEVICGNSFDEDRLRFEPGDKLIYACVIPSRTTTIPLKGVRLVARIHPRVVHVVRRCDGRTRP